jgi:hypothetical protein
MIETSARIRRSLLKGAAVLAGASLTSRLGTRSAQAQQKASKTSMKYQDKPNEDKQCSNCSQFVAPDSCKIVEGAISPRGYCIAWQKK